MIQSVAAWPPAQVVGALFFVPCLAVAVVWFVLALCRREVWKGRK